MVLHYNPGTVGTRGKALYNLHTALYRLAPKMGLYWGHMDLGLPNPHTGSGTFGSVSTPMCEAPSLLLVISHPIN